MDYQYENGRRYHAYEAGKYHLPNDEQESSRLDLQHHLWLLSLGGRLFEAPISPDIRTALDIGTGTGLWAIEFADEHPQTSVIGTDLSPTQPTLVPPNCQFLVDDAERPDWAFEPQDYIHSRMLTISLRDWPSYFKRCFEALKPGGWLEVQETGLEFKCDDGTTPEDDAAVRWSKHCATALLKIGINNMAMNNFKEWLAEAGFTNIVKKEYFWPVGQWMEGTAHQEIGKYTKVNIIEGSRSTIALLTRVLGWSKEEAEVLAAQVRECLNHDERHRYGTVSTVHYAQKPITEEPESASTPPKQATASSPTETKTNPPEVSSEAETVAPVEAA